jgi:serine protease Do
MKTWNTAARRGALVAAVAMAVGAGTVIHGQGREERAARVLDRLSGSWGESGVSVRDVEPHDATPGKTASPPGVLIQDVSAGGPAEKAGIKKGDVVVEFDGERVRSVRQFTRLVQETPPGRQVPAAVMRNGQRVNITVEPRAASPIRLLGEVDGRVLRDFGGAPPAPPLPPAPPRPPAPPAPPAAPAFPDFENFIWRSDGALGITVTSLSSQLADYFGAKGGVLVTSVRDNSAAQAAGFKAGDVVTALNGQQVSDPSDLRQRTERLRDGDEFTADVMRDKKAMTLKGKMERRTTNRGTTRTAP